MYGGQVCPQASAAEQISYCRSATHITCRAASMGTAASLLTLRPAAALAAGVSSGPRRGTPACSRILQINTNGCRPPCSACPALQLDSSAPYLFAHTHMLHTSLDVKDQSLYRAPRRARSAPALIWMAVFLLPLPAPSCDSSSSCTAIVLRDQSRNRDQQCSGGWYGWLIVPPLHLQQACTCSGSSSIAPL